jgi:methionyl-tRNA synthetase
MEKPKIEFSEFLEIEKKLEIKLGLILTSEDVPKSNKLIKLTVDFGNEDVRTVVTNIKPELSKIWTDYHTFLVGTTFPFITNLVPVKMMGIESTAMIMPGNVETNEFIQRIIGPTGTKLL